MASLILGEPIWTHQIPRVCDEAKPEILRQHPDLANITVPPLGGIDEVLTWLATTTRTYGDTRTVLPLSKTGHTSIDPLTELAMNQPHITATTVVISEDAHNA